MPPAIRQLLRRCLERQPKNRLHEIADARIVLDDVLAGRLDLQSDSETAVSAPVPLWRRAVPWTIAVIGLVLAGLSYLHSGGTSPGGMSGVSPSPATAFGVELPPGFVIAGNDAPVIDLSRDGRTLVFVADGPKGAQLFRRSLDRVGSEPIDGTAGAQHPFLSPDVELGRLLRRRQDP